MVREAAGGSGGRSGAADQRLPVAERGGEARGGWGMERRGGGRGGVCECGGADREGSGEERRRSGGGDGGEGDELWGVGGGEQPIGELFEEERSGERRASG